MPFTSMDNVIAGLAGIPPMRARKAAFTGQAAGFDHSFLYLAGFPAAAAAPAPGVNGAVLTSTGLTGPGYAGQIPFPAAVGGKEIRLARFTFQQGGNIAGAVLIDRVWHNSGLSVTSTSLQSFASGALARDADGAATGRGLVAWLEVTTTLGAFTANTVTLTYTNSAGVASRTGTLIQNVPSAAVAGTRIPFVLQAGDLGIQSVQGAQNGVNMVSGAYSIVVGREIADALSVSSSIPDREDAIAVGLPLMYAGSVPELVYLLSGTAAGITGAFVSYAQN